ncbi:hypothetical protein TWF481_006496 [Arthrobotrys musiformis]|uniref:Uncharacterized protein n=1 Tax=Arthrobotrys musiformis TaxID=47236 RepID=A0AAV9W8N9_9PEZI
MSWSTPTSILLHHRRPAFPASLKPSRLILHTVSKCPECFHKELDKEGCAVEHKPCVNGGKNDKKGLARLCDEEVVKGNTGGEGGKCWVCVFRGKVEDFVKNSDEYADMIKL